MCVYWRKESAVENLAIVRRYNTADTSEPRSDPRLWFLWSRILSLQSFDSSCSVEQYCSRRWENKTAVFRRESRVFSNKVNEIGAVTDLKLQHSLQTKLHGWWSCVSSLEASLSIWTGYSRDVWYPAKLGHPLLKEHAKMKQVYVWDSRLKSVWRRCELKGLMGRYLNVPACLPSLLLRFIEGEGWINNQYYIAAFPFRVRFMLISVPLPLRVCCFKW